MGYWTRLIRWCRRPGMVKVQHNPRSIDLILVTVSVVLGFGLLVGAWQYAAATSTMTSLNAQIGQLESEVQTLLERRQELENQTQTLKERISSLENELNGSRATAESFLETIVQLSDESAQYLAEIRGLRRSEAPPLQLSDVNIVTAEPDGIGRLRVWTYVGNGYDNIWAAECVGYISVAIGDADNDGKREIVGSTRREVKEGRGESGISWYEVFFDAYKEGEGDVWLSSEGVREDRYHWMHRITIADIDEDRENEVVMITAHSLVVYKFLENSFKIVSSRNSFVEGRTLLLRSLVVRDIDGDGVNEVLVSAHDEEMYYEGYLLMFKGVMLEPVDVAYVDASLSIDLCVGDLDDHGHMEICSTGTRQVGDRYRVYTFVWKYEGTLELIVEHLAMESSDWMIRSLTVGELRGEYPGEEIIAATLLEPSVSQLTMYSLDSKSIDGTLIYELVERKREILHFDPLRVSINHLYIGDPDADGQDEIIACGGNFNFYLEVLDVNLNSEWQRSVKGGWESDVWYAAVG